MLICDEIHRRLDYVMEPPVVSMLVTACPCVGRCMFVCVQVRTHVYLTVLLLADS